VNSCGNNQELPAHRIVLNVNASTFPGVTITIPHHTVAFKGKGSKSSSRVNSILKKDIGRDAIPKRRVLLGFIQYEGHLTSVNLTVHLPKNGATDLVSQAIIIVFLSFLEVVAEKIK